MKYSPLHSLCKSITDCPHSTPEWTTSGRVVIRNQNIKNGKLDLSSPSYTTTHDFQRRIIRAKPASGDIIITREAPMGEACLVPEGLECCLGQRMVLLKPDDKECNNRYLLYAILSPYVQHQISWSYGTGTTVSNLRIPHLETLKIPCPDRNIQDFIAAILSSLDDKIELNNRIIANLEAQAQAIFKSWFVDFEPFQDGEFEESELGLIPKGWRVDKIGSMPILVTDFVANGSFATLKENVTIHDEPDYAFFIRNTDLKSQQFDKYVDKQAYDFLSKSRLVGGEVIISNVGDVGSVFLCPNLDKPMTLGNNVILVNTIQDESLNWYLYILFKYFYGKDLIQGITSGSAQPKFNKTDFRALRIIIPPLNELVSFNELMHGIFSMKSIKNEENVNCANTRDTLLPKLISGEIEVPVEG